MGRQVQRLNVQTRDVTTTAVLAVDPGGTTGWARYSPATLQLVRGQESPEEFLRWSEHSVEEWTAAGLDVVIVAEKYTITPDTLRKTRQYDALYTIGALAHFARKFECEFVLQTPAEAKGFTSNARLAELEIYSKGEDHANDALRHLILWLAKSGHLATPDLFLVECS